MVQNAMHILVNAIMGTKLGVTSNLSLITVMLLFSEWYKLGTVTLLPIYSHVKTIIYVKFVERCVVHGHIIRLCRELFFLSYQQSLTEFLCITWKFNQQMVVHH